MVIYKYSPYWDAVWFIRNYKNRAWLREHNIVYLSFSFQQLFRNIFHKHYINTNKLRFETTTDVTCYWISSGTWGAYTPPGAIFICPEQIQRGGGIAHVIQHEITHLEHDDETVYLDHEEKERLINSKMGKQ